MVERELWFSDEFLPRFTERLVLIGECIRNKKDIPEPDQEVIAEVHRIWFNGALGWTKSSTPVIVEAVATQGGLFDRPITNILDNFDSSDNARDQIVDGKDIVRDCKETNKPK